MRILWLGRLRVPVCVPADTVLSPETTQLELAITKDTVCQPERRSRRGTSVALNELNA